LTGIKHRDQALFWTGSSIYLTLVLIGKRKKHTMPVIDIVMLFVGLTVLIMGSRSAVEQAVLIAEHYRLSDMFIGVAILAIGSDLPEIVIALTASLHQTAQIDTSGLIIGEAIGSSFAQIGLIMGIVGLYGYLVLGRNLVFRHGGVLLGAILYLLLASLDLKISRIEGGILVLAFIVYVVMLYGQEHLEPTAPRRKRPRMLKVWAILAFSLLAVIGGSELTVRNAIALAETFGIAQSFIAIVIIGIGTSLPELAISISAVRQARGGLSVGNLIGSNIVDTLLPVGVGALIHPLTVEHRLVAIDIPLLFILSIVVLVLFLWRRGLQRSEAGALIALYGGYLIVKLAGY
jgi:cation:H+ antiporter